MKNTLLFIFALTLFPVISNAQSQFPEKTEAAVEKTGINSSVSEMGPAFVENELWFSVNTLQENMRKNTMYYELFASAVDAKGNLAAEVKTQKLEEVRAGYNAGPVSYCKATGELFVTVNNHDNPQVENVVFKKASIPLKIVILRKSGNSWTVREELPFNNSSYSVGHPAISATGDTLYFASDIDGKGKGETDLYMTVRKNGKWGEMINLGDKINTGGDEMFPFLHKGKYLFFASDGRSDNAGGLDLYYSKITSSGFETPVNMKSLNSPEDDFGLVIHPGEETGYFVSNRPGGSGNDDIYKVVFETEPEVVEAPKKIEDLEPEKVEVGQKFLLDNIYYDFDKWDILPESETELDKLIKVMNENPKWKIELGSHTDSRGTHAYNERLSQRRSESAVNYIVSRGISKNRITAKGYGETQLINHCADGVECTEEQHRQNRRTEFTIIEIE